MWGRWMFGGFFVLMDVQIHAWSFSNGGRDGLDVLVVGVAVVFHDHVTRGPPFARRFVLFRLFWNSWENFCFFLLLEFPKPDCFFFVGQYGGRNHSGEKTAIVSALLASSPALDCDQAISAESAMKGWLLRFLMSSPEELTTAGVNFINVLWAAFTSEDSKSTKRYRWLDWILMLLGSALIKASHKMLVKLAPEANDAAVVADMFLAGFCQFLTDKASL
jgi:hypothetical protein